MPAFKVLILDDEEDMLEVCRGSLRRLPDLRIVTESRSQHGLELLGSESFDLLLVDLRMPEHDGLEVLEVALERQPDIQVIMITGFPTIETAVEAIRRGARDYIVKPFSPEDLRAKVEQALGPKRVDGGEHSFDGMIGKSPPMQRVFDFIRQVAPTNADVLILGESGTGKELIARSIHRRSGRAGRFVPVDCGAIPENLLESELFGHEKGAFTGAVEPRIGLLEFAQAGTFFLDELCELALNLQARLLRALQEHTFRRVGGKVEIGVDLRVVAATNRDIEKDVRDERFRSDLYYRINVVKIVVPPLRERREDIPLLVDHFIGRYAREAGKALRGVEPDAMGLLLDHPWRGNVRELQNVLRRTVTLARSERIHSTDLPEELHRGEGAEVSEDFYELRSRKVESFEREYLLELLEQVKGDIARATKAASLPRATLYRLLKKHRIDPAQFR